MLRDIKPPVYFKSSYFLLILLTVLFLSALLTFLVLHFLKRRKKEEAAGPAAPPKAAHETAYEALEELKSKNLPASGKIKEYYFILSAIVRRYIEERFDISAPEMTTEEFLFALRNSGRLSGAHKNLLKEFLNLCDIVKFAKYGPNEKETDNSFEAARRFIDETKQAQRPRGEEALTG